MFPLIIVILCTIEMRCVSFKEIKVMEKAVKPWHEMNLFNNHLINSDCTERSCLFLYIVGSLKNQQFF